MTREERAEAIKAFIQEKEMEIEALSQEPCEDAVSRKAVIDALEKVAELFPWRVPGKYDTYNGDGGTAVCQSTAKDGALDKVV